MTYEEFSQVAAGIQSLVTAFSIGVGGVWVYTRFRRQREAYALIQFTADIVFVGRQGGGWVVELVASIVNKGRVRHTMKEFTFELSMLRPTDALTGDERWGGQIDFPHLVSRGSFLPSQCEYFFIEPGIEAKYSYVTTVPADAAFLLLHTSFNYQRSKREGHTAERSISVPLRHPEDHCAPQLV